MTDLREQVQTAPRISPWKLPFLRRTFPNAGLPAISPGTR